MFCITPACITHKDSHQKESKQPTPENSIETCHLMTVAFHYLNTAAFFQTVQRSFIKRHHFVKIRCMSIYAEQPD